jgi:hypothetical protein
MAKLNSKNWKNKVIKVWFDSGLLFVLDFVLSESDHFWWGGAGERSV